MSDNTGVDADNACEITTWTELQAINDSDAARGLYYKLMNNLRPDCTGDSDCSDEGYGGIGDDFTPIGSGIDRGFYSTDQSGYFFRGRFDGNNKTIAGLEIDKYSSSYLDDWAYKVGLFSVLGGDAEVFDLTLSDFEILGRGDVGSLAGVLVDNARVRGILVKDGSVEMKGGTDDVGGLFAISDMSSDQEPNTKHVVDTGVDNVIVTVDDRSARIGGLVGVTFRTHFERVFFNGQLVGPVTTAGGLLGYTTGGSVKDGYSIGSVEITSGGDTFYKGDNVSGIVGAARNGVDIVIENVYTAMSFSFPDEPGFDVPGGVTTRFEALGGVSGSAPDVDMTKLAETTFYDLAQGGITSIKSGGQATSTADLLTSQTFIDAGWDFDTVWQQDEGVSYPYFQNFPSQSEAPKPADIDCPTDLTKADDGFCEITDWNDLTKINEKPSLSYRLTRDLNESHDGHQANWAPLSLFGGVFDGNEKTINDLIIIGADGDDHLGLFSAVSHTGVIRDLAIIDVVIKTGEGEGFGAVAGEFSGTIQDTYVSGTISRADPSPTNDSIHVGGLVGTSYRWSVPVIERSAADITVELGSADNYVGGLVGRAWNISVLNSFANLSVQSAGEYQGGLIGSRDEGSTIVNSYSRSSFAGTDTNHGGLSGGTVDTGVSNSYWDADVTDIQSPLTGGGGAPRSTFEMKFASTFAGWDFGSSETAGVWSIINEDVEGEPKKRVSYPYLTKLAEHGFIDATNESDIGAIDEVSPPLELATSAPFTPQAGATGVVPFTGIRVTFAEAIAATGTGTITLKDSSGTAVSFEHALTGSAITITPTAILFDDETYTIEIPAGFVASSADSGKENLILTWSFSTQPSTVDDAALDLFNDIISADNLNLTLSATNADELEAAATAASTIINVANGTEPQSALTIDMLSDIGITGLTAENFVQAALAIFKVTDTSTIDSVAGVQAIIDAGFSAYEATEQVFDEFFDDPTDGTPPTDEDYTNIGIKDVTPGNEPAVNDLLANSTIQTIDTEGIQHIVDAYNEIIDALGATPKRNPDLTAEDLAVLGLGEIILNDDALELFNSLLGQETVSSVEGWATANPVTTFANLESIAELAAKVIAAADGNPATPATLDADDLAGLGVDSTLSPAGSNEEGLFKEVVGLLSGPDVSSVEKLTAIADA
ncbi:MAG TPA: Ig-like domain-containing protein, partial [Wenzhouxiangella sp.]